MIIRSAIWKATFYCCYGGNVVTPKKIVFDQKQFVEAFDTTPTESLSQWAERVARDKAETMGQESCSELASQFSVCGLGVDIISTEEIDTEAKPTKKKEMPTDVKRRIQHIKELQRTAVTKEQKQKYQDMIDEITKEYE